MVMLKNSNYNNTKKTETKWGKRSTLVHPKLYVRSFVPQMISVRVMVVEVPCEYHFEGDNFRGVG